MCKERGKVNAPANLCRVGDGGGGRRCAREGGRARWGEAGGGAREGGGERVRAAMPRVGGPDAAPCAAIGGARRRPQQNSQRVLLAMVRRRWRAATGDVARRREPGGWGAPTGGGGQASRPTATGPHGNGCGRGARERCMATGHERGVRGRGVRGGGGGVLFCFQVSGV